ncbi:MAG TPA: permease-like cell division protein FtsX [Chitinophagales bacterium]|nr:permease-like cell division protein FtsX [Chitinophagales bacterium]
MKPYTCHTFLNIFAAMSQTGKSSLKRKATHYLNAILVTGLSLFLLGLMGILFLSFEHEQNRIKERIRISAFLNDEMKPADLEILQKKIEAESYVNATEYISKEQAAEIVKNKFGEDISELLGDYNPLPASIEIYLKAEMVTTDSIAAYQERLATYPGIKFTKTDENLVGSLDASFKIIGYVALGLCLLFLIISIAIVDKTIRLSMYSNRFLIRSMQLVGATRKFVTGPYVRRSILNGIVSALVAIVIIGGILFFVQQKFHYWDFTDQRLTTGIGILALILLALGILITWVSTRTAVHKYIKMRLDDLY